MIDIKIDLEGMRRTFNEAQQKQLPFAMSRAINDTAKQAQEAIRAGIKARFTLRKETFILRTVKIEKADFATKRNPLAFRVKIDDGVYKSGKRDLLAKFEDGDRKEASSPMMPVAIPSSNLRPSFSAIVPRKLYPSSLRLVDRRNIVGTLPAQVKISKRGMIRIMGKLKTFVLDPRQHFGVKTWGVYQRTGPGPKDVRLLWTYKMSVSVPKILRFVDTAQLTMDQRFDDNFARAFAHAMATAR